jgi:hypothetical protein
MRRSDDYAAGVESVSKPAMADHPFNYVREDGAPPRRPAPPRYQLTPATTRLREFLAADFRNVKPHQTPMIASDYGKRLFDAAWEGDLLMDAVVGMFNRMPRGQGRRLLLQALDQGIDSLENPPEELVQLFAQLDVVPDWVDWDLVEAGVMALDKTSYLGFMLGSVLGSLATAGSQSISIPVGMTGRFKRNVVSRSIESIAFYNTTASQGGLRRFAPGFKAAVNVRLMHAMVRAKMIKSKEGELFDYARNGNPMNQADTAFGIPFFGLQIGLCERVFGHPVSQRDLEGLRMLWSYIGYLMGVRDDIVPKTAEENFYLMDVMWANLGEPSKYTMELYDALFNGFEEAFTRNHQDVLWKRVWGRTLFDLLHTYTRFMLGDELCDEMQSIRKVRHLKWLPRTHARANKVIQKFRSRHQRSYRGSFRPEGGKLFELAKALLQPDDKDAVVTYAHHDNLTRAD